MIYAAYVKVALRKPQIGWVKLKTSLGTGQAKFSLGEGIKSTGLGFIGSVTEGLIIVLYSVQNVLINWKKILAILNFYKDSYIAINDFRYAEKTNEICWKKNFGSYLHLI